MREASSSKDDKNKTCNFLLFMSLRGFAVWGILTRKTSNLGSIGNFVIVH